MTTLPTVLLQYGPHGPHAPHGPVGPGGHMGTGPVAGQWLGLGAAPWLWLLALVVLAALVAAVLLARADRPGTAGGSSDPALARLRERYAAGDVDDEEYHRRRAVLSGDRTRDA